MLSQVDVARSITNAELETQFKAFAKGELATALKHLHAQIKKDVHAEISKAIAHSLTAELADMTEKALTRVLEKVQTTVDTMNTAVKRKEGGGSSRFRRNKNTASVESEKKQTRKTQAVLTSPGRLSLLASPPPVEEADTSGQRELHVVMAETTDNTDLSYEEATRGSQMVQLLAQPENLSAPQSPLENFVLSQSFEYFSAFVVTLNAIMLGFETQMQVLPGGPSSAVIRYTYILDIVFCVIFTSELILRISVYREQIWFDAFILQSMCFDSSMVLLQVLDLVSSPMGLNVHVVSILRVCRIARVIRLLHLFDELSAVISSMANSVGPLLWTVVLVIIMMYMFSIMMMQILLTTGDLHANSDFEKWFGSLDRAIQTMFEILLGGITWGDVLWELGTELNPCMSLAMSCYITLSLFFLMNLVCGVFVDRVTKTVREDKDEYMAQSIGEIFAERDESGREKELTWEDFAAKLNTKPVQAYFHSIDVQPDFSEARHLFELIDHESRGSIGTSDIVAGCLRLRGPAKALDVALLSSDVHRVIGQVAANFAALETLRQTIQPIPATLEKVVEAMKAQEDEEDPPNEDDMTTLKSNKRQTT